MPAPPQKGEEMTTEEIYDFRIRQCRLKGTKIIICWWCGRKIWGNKVTVKRVDGHNRRMHKICVKRMDVVKAQGCE